MMLGSRVMRNGWEMFPDYEHLARLGRVTHVASPQLVEVLWDSGTHAPSKITLEPTDALTWLWWRST